MKNFISPFFLFLLFIAGCAPSRSNVSVRYDNSEGIRAEVGYEAFYNELSPYGRWVDYPDYGYVWIPNAEVGFRPYASNGHWVYTDYGWTWVSGYQWGWAAFHYGRWMYEEGYGWMWMPGREWAPAWVTWGRSGNYYGWAPLAPRVNINISIGSGWTPPQHYWNFVPAQHITQVNVSNYVVNTTNNVSVVNNITKNVTVINNNSNNKTVYDMGPQKADVENQTKKPVHQFKMTEANKPGETVVSNDKLVLYKPTVKEETENKAVPAKVEAYKALNKTIPKNENEINRNPTINNDVINDNKNTDTRPGVKTRLSDANNNRPQRSDQKPEKHFKQVTGSDNNKQSSLNKNNNKQSSQTQFQNNRPEKPFTKSANNDRSSKPNLQNRPAQIERPKQKQYSKSGNGNNNENHKEKKGDKSE